MLIEMAQYKTDASSGPQFIAQPAAMLAMIKRRAASIGRVAQDSK
jgi:hypothetical protein